jgi:hypothetical protein
MRHHAVLSTPDAPRHQTLLHDCDRQLQPLLQDQPRPEQHAVSALVCGVVSRQQAQLSQAGPGIPGPAQDLSKQRRAQRLVANPRLHVARAQRRLAAHVLRRCRTQVTLLLDSTVQGPTATQAGTVTLCLAVVWDRRAVPLAWQVASAGTPGAGSFAHLAELLDTIRPALRPGADVLLLADRGLSSRRLAAAARERGWHFGLRLTRGHRVQLPAGRVATLGSLVRPRHRVRRVAGGRIWAPRHKAGRGAGGWVTDWSAGVVVNLVLVAGPADDPWLVVTDLPPEPERLAEYCQRMRIEELFRDLKSFGWQWQQSRLREPDRVARLLVVLALATVWMLALGEAIVASGQRVLVEGHRPIYSRFQLGLRWFLRCLVTDQPLPCTFLLPLQSSPPPPFGKLS